MRDDATLVDLAVQGDSTAFAELYERYFDRVFDFLARMVRSEAEAADLAQDTFVRAMNSLGSLAKGGSFKSWLFTIARNTALNRIERSSRLQPLQGRSDDDDEPSFDVVDSDRFSDPAEAAEAKDLAGFVWEAAKGLDPNQYAVLDLTVRQGLDSAEIADVLGVTKNNAYVMVNRMKKSLEDAIGALMLFKSGRGGCPELDAALTKLELGEMSPEARRLIDRHSSKCPVCSDKKKRMTSPFAIFGAFAAVYPVAGTKAGILEGLLQGYPYAGAAAGAGAGGGTGSDSVVSFGNTGASGNAGSQDGYGSGTTAGGGGAGSTAGYGSGGSSGVAAGTAAESGDDDGGSKKGMLKIALGAAAVLLIGLTSYIVVSGQAGETESVQTLAIVQSPSATAAAATPTPVETATVEPTATAEVTATPGTPVPVLPGPQQPRLVPPPPGQQGPPPGQPAPPVPQPPEPVNPVVVPPLTTPPCLPAISASTGALEFGATQTLLTFSLGGNDCPEPAAYQASANQDWVTVAPAAGQVVPGGGVAITVRIDRADLPRGGSATLEVSGDWGSLRVPIRVSAAPTVEPLVTSTRGLTIRPTSTPCIPLTPSLPCP